MQAEASRPLERLVAKLLRELLAGEQFESIGDLREALKCRCAKERIPYDGDLVDRAIALVGSNTPLIVRPPR